ncbi:class I SAM-dependent methyltransferase [Saccharopolyspora griseoalba]|uniref:Class I SAM-dependent methyltransferase n=1 Tax=Saccharopolyspora griseoalba TaxID=1431848 RepID=A0ABW2LEQ1_9PSEU
MDGARDGKLRRYWDRSAPSYDRAMGYFERFMAGDSRSWVCSRARGAVLEVAIGTGLNLPSYPAEVQLTGIEWSPQMLQLARLRAAELGTPAELLEGDARELPFDEASFDTAVCTFSLCAIPEHDRAVAEMHRVLRPGGTLLLADHVVSTAWPARLVQRAAELITVPMGGEHFRRRPAALLRAAGFDIVEQERFKLGIIERLTARKAG